MANKFFNFKIPNFQERHGTDWDSFKTIIDTNVDLTFQKVWELYHINDINKMSARVVQAQLDILGIPYSEDDTFATKKLRLRTYASKFVNKGLATIYLDVGEEITGTRGILYNGAFIQIWRWGVARWSQIRWTQVNPQFVIYFDCKTTDNTELDLIQSLLQDKSIKPAFYRVYLTDVDLNILRTI